MATGARPQGQPHSHLHEAKSSDHRHLFAYRGDLGTTSHHPCSSGIWEVEIQQGKINPSLTCQRWLADLPHPALNPRKARLTRPPQADTRATTLRARACSPRTTRAGGGCFIFKQRKHPAWRLSPRTRRLSRQQRRFLEAGCRFQHRGRAGGVVAAMGRLYPGHAGSRDVRCWHNAAHRLKTPDRWGENGCGEMNRGTVPATLRKAEGRGAPVRSSGLAAAAQLQISQLAQQRVWCYSLGSG